MSSASLRVALGTFIRFEDGKAGTGTAVDAGNFRESHHVAKDRVLIVCIIRLATRRR